MTFKTRFRTALVLTAAAGAALLASTALGAAAPTTISFVVQNNGTEYQTRSGSTRAFPGRLETGDRILTRDRLLEGTRAVGYDNEICTVTFDDNDLCQVMLVVPGRGEIEGTWLWIGRNRSASGPSHFSGVIDGGTGGFAHARGQFTASVLANGAPTITATLG
jgi:hypothetical protein